MIQGGVVITLQFFVFLGINNDQNGAVTSGDQVSDIAMVVQRISGKSIVCIFSGKELCSDLRKF